MWFISTDYVTIHLDVYFVSLGSFYSWKSTEDTVFVDIKTTMFLLSLNGTIPLILWDIGHQSTWTEYVERI